MKLSSEQKHISRRIAQIAKEVKASPKEVKAAYETGLVESGMRNLSGGDADSQGWRQERASLYPNPRNLDASIRRFFKETSAVKHKYGRAGDLAAAVQRPAAQYRGRYQQRSADAESLMRQFVGGGGNARSSSTTKTITTPGTPDQVRYDSTGVLALLSDKSKSKGNPLDFAQRLLSNRTVIEGTPASTQTVSVSGSQSGGSDTSKAMSRANAIDKKKLPYKWGGGHGGKVNAYKATPLDCSGAVSAVLGINPRVSGQFRSWGKAGDGGKKGITIYANDEHVLMKIDGRFFGTSKSNPGGGAGWIPQAQVSDEYLKGFTARHR